MHIRTAPNTSDLYSAHSYPGDGIYYDPNGCMVYSVWSGAVTAQYADHNFQQLMAASAPGSGDNLATALDTLLVQKNVLTEYEVQQAMQMLGG